MRRGLVSSSQWHQQEPTVRGWEGNRRRSLQSPHVSDQAPTYQYPTLHHHYRQNHQTNIQSDLHGLPTRSINTQPITPISKDLSTRSVDCGRRQSLFAAHGLDKLDDDTLEQLKRMLPTHLLVSKHVTSITSHVWSSLAAGASSLTSGQSPQDSRSCSDFSAQKSNHRWRRVRLESEGW